MLESPVSSIGKALSIAALCGGPSPKREVFLSGGKRVMCALKRLWYHVTEVDLDKEVAHKPLELKPDLVYNMLHGKYGKDGRISGLADVIGLPYTHSGCGGSSIGLNKVANKHVLRFLGIDFPEFRVATKEEILSCREIMPCLFVVKPIGGGSSIRVRAVFSHGEYSDIAAHASELEERMLVEEYLGGQELHTSVFLGKAVDNLEFLYGGRIHSYDAKYTNGLSRHVFPAAIPNDVYDATMQRALKPYEALKCGTMVRVDLKYDSDNNVLKLLEINTHPCMTDLSALPESVKLGWGLDFDQIVDLVVKEALLHYA
ncbi:MAG: D-alanine--D-alanine ligase [Anaplasma sp.]